MVHTKPYAVSYATQALDQRRYKAVLEVACPMARASLGRRLVVVR